MIELWIVARVQTNPTNQLFRYGLISQCLPTPTPTSLSRRCSPCFNTLISRTAIGTGRLGFGQEFGHNLFLRPCEGIGGVCAGRFAPCTHPPLPY